MIVRRHRTAERDSVATFSDCRRYRYALERRWAAGPLLLFVMLNPSRATEREDDPTTARCGARARRLGYAAFGAVNLFALIATRPAELRRAAAPLGPENDAAILRAAAGAGTVLCAWGGHGAFRARGAEVAALLRATGRPLAHLGLTRRGQPRHPLYVPADAPLLALDVAASQAGANPL